MSDGLPACRLCCSPFPSSAWASEALAGPEAVASEAGAPWLITGAVTHRKPLRNCSQSVAGAHGLYSR